MTTKLFTSCWLTYSGPGRVGISRGTPRGAKAGYRMYRKLAPTREIMALGAKALYEPRYIAEILGQLDPHETVAEVRQLAGDWPPVMLCFERPPLDEVNFCHRTMVADWLISHGYDVQEWSGEEDSNPRRQDGLPGLTVPREDETKTDAVRRMVRSGMMLDALRIAKDFTIWPTEVVKRRVQRAWEAVKRPEFLRQIGRDPDQCLQAGYDELKAIYG